MYKLTLAIIHHFYQMRVRKKSKHLRAALFGPVSTPPFVKSLLSLGVTIWALPFYGFYRIDSETKKILERKAMPSRILLYPMYYSSISYDVVYF